MFDLFIPKIVVTMGAIKQRRIYIPDQMREFRILAVAPGGYGGASHGGARGGGGGGAGGGCDVVVTLAPGSQFICDWDGSTYLTLYYYREGDANGSPSRIVLQRGRIGGSATASLPGSGGASGDGNTGGVAVTPGDETRAPYGTLGADGKMETCGGWAGNDATIIPGIGSIDINGAYSRTAAGARGTRYAQKFPTLHPNVANTGGAGGCSILAPGGPHGYRPGFGAGQAGASGWDSYAPNYSQGVLYLYSRLLK